MLKNIFNFLLSIITTKPMFLSNINLLLKMVVGRRSSRNVSAMSWVSTATKHQCLLQNLLFKAQQVNKYHILLFNIICANSCTIRFIQFVSEIPARYSILIHLVKNKHFSFDSLFIPLKWGWFDPHYSVGFVFQIIVFDNKSLINYDSRVMLLILFLILMLSTQQ